MSDMTRDQKIGLIYAFFDWLNGLSGSDRPISISDIERFFTSDAVLTLNGERICQGWEGQLAHGRDLQEKMRSWRFHAPFQEVVVEDDRVVGYYSCDFLTKEGVPITAYDMCLWKLRDGRIAEILETVFFAGGQFEVDAFDS